VILIGNRTVEKRAGYSSQNKFLPLESVIFVGLKNKNRNVVDMKSDAATKL
jgi:hypothetical protein